LTDLLERLTAALADRYAIKRKLGAGGMATVYLAEDMKHHRKVAVKVLRPELTAVLGSERFLNEITVTANLQHPHILALHDSGEADSFLYYVMPYIEGESLRDKLNREKQLSIEESVEITKAVASALDYAHRREVIHRDVKPENILLQDGQALVADFGIALAVSAAGGMRLTETGLSLGTPHYMSPEQATADRELDGRSDLYSLACVTYEMLAGQPPFIAPNAQAVVAKILAEDPGPVTAHRRSVPLHMDAALQKALAKLPADRFDDAMKFVEALTSPWTSSTLATTAAEPRIGPGRKQVWTWPALTLAAILGLWGWFRPQPTAEPAVPARFAVPLPPSAQLGNAGGNRVVISPDGSTIGYIGEGPEGRILYLRSLGELDSRPLPGTENASDPFFSPDSRWIGFDRLGQMWKISLDGGAPVPIGRDGLRGASWGTNDTIIYSPTQRAGLSLISADGGPPVVLTSADTAARETDHAYPTLLPGGHAALFTTLFGTAGKARVSVVDVKTGVVRHLAEGRSPVYAQSGHILYGSRDGVLRAAPFNLDRLELTGPGVPVEEGLNTDRVMAEYALAQNGTLVYASIDADASRSLVLVDRQGGERVIATPAQPSFGPRFSRDGRLIAVHLLGGGGGTIWTYNSQGSDFSKLTLGGENFYPSWTPDGRYVSYTKRGMDGTNIYRRRADGATVEEQVFHSERQQWETSWAPNGLQVVVRENDPETGRDLWLWTLDGDGNPEPLVRTPANERAPAVSPNGLFLAYASDETGQSQVYVQPFPRGDGRWQVSTEGGTEPVWAPDGRELFYRHGDAILAVSVRTDPVFSPGIPEVVIRGPYATNSTHTNYDVHPEGDRFVMIKVPEGAAQLFVIVNWFEVLRGSVGRVLD
jgi:serine/threonine-protein kinase